MFYGSNNFSIEILYGTVLYVCNIFKLISTYFSEECPSNDICDQLQKINNVISSKVMNLFRTNFPTLCFTLESDVLATIRKETLLITILQYKYGCHKHFNLFVVPK